MSARLGFTRLSQLDRLSAKHVVKLPAICVFFFHPLAVDLDAPQIRVLSAAGSQPIALYAQLGVTQEMPRPTVQNVLLER